MEEHQVSGQRATLTAAGGRGDEGGGGKGGRGEVVTSVEETVVEAMALIDWAYMRGVCCWLGRR